MPVYGRPFGLVLIAINRVKNERAENNWSIGVLSAGDADANTPARAALNVQDALRHDYNLGRIKRPVPL
jgi:hypothetical protein